MLVANGHRLDDVLHHYTIPQVELFAQLAGRRILNDARLAAASMRAAGVKDKDWKKFMRSLEPRAVSDSGEAPADALVRQLKASGLWHSLSK